MSTEILILIITNIVSPIVTGWFTWFLTKKKYNIEVDGAKIDNLQKIIDGLATEILGLRDSVNMYMDRNKQLELEVIELRKLMFDLMANICMDLTCTHRKFDESKKRKRTKDGE